MQHMGVEQRLFSACGLGVLRATGMGRSPRAGAVSGVAADRGAASGRSKPRISGGSARGVARFWGGGAAASGDYPLTG